MITLVVGVTCLVVGAVGAATCFILAIRWGLIGPPPPGHLM
jgi:hypothetical protein